jgi:hypothetical protein
MRKVRWTWSNTRYILCCNSIAATLSGREKKLGIPCIGGRLIGAVTGGSVATYGLAAAQVRDCREKQGHTTVSVDKAASGGYRYNKPKS